MNASAKSLLDFETVAPATISTRPANQGRCADCGLRRLCQSQACGSNPTAQVNEQWESVVQHTRPLLRRKEELFRQGDAFDTLYVVRAGAIKTSMVSESGEEHVTGFYLPGDIVGTDGLSTNAHATTAVALETTSVCALPFTALEKLATQVPDVQRYVFQVLAREIQNDQQMMMILSRKNAEQRLAAMLLRFSQHLQKRKLLGDNIRLPMSRNDIGNYLGLAVETVCRILTRFQKMALIQVEGRDVTLLDSARLRDLAEHLEAA